MSFYKNLLIQYDTAKLSPKITKIYRMLFLIGMVLLFLGYTLYLFFPSSKEEKLSFVGPVVALGGILTWIAICILLLISVSSGPQTKKLVRFKLVNILWIVGLGFIASGLIVVLVVANGSNHPGIQNLFFSIGLLFICLAAGIDKLL